MHNLNSEILDFKKRENFPVASIFLPKAARKPILAFYNFARITDEIADSKTLPQTEKLAQLNAIYTDLQNQNLSTKFGFLQPLFIHTKNGDICIKNCLALLEAFIQDVQNPEYNNFDDLLKYCRKSAASVGRIVLEACEEYAADFDASDKICSILQILNHLQDLKADYANLQRLYFAKNSLNLEDLKLEHETIKTMEFKTNVLNEVKLLLDSAKHLPQTISSIRVRIEIQTIINICYCLHEKLLSNNIMQKRVELTNLEKITCVLKALPVDMFGAKNKNIRHKTKSSFFAPLLKLPHEKQQAMFSFYAFCHEVDDVVDERASDVEANNNLNFWINEIEQIYSTNSLSYPTHPIAKALIKPIAKYNLQKKYFLEIIQGQFLDLQNSFKTPPSDKLFEDYCYKVASCVGLVAVDVFGYAEHNKNKIEQFAINLGHALQIINIMRDVEEDAERGRIYIPQSLIQNTKLANITPEDLYKNFKNYKPELQNILKSLAKKVEYYFEQSDKNLPPAELNNMKVALLIRKVYESYFNKMKTNNFIFEKSQIKLSNIEKFKILKI
jgi:phytoene/squalene synthetase